MYKRFTTIAGRTIITRCTDSSRIKTNKQRKPRMNPTPEAVAKVNAMNRIRDLTAKLNANFRPGDLWITLSYPEKVPMEEAMRNLERFKRNLRGMCRRRGIPFRLIEATGIGKVKGKPHHHIVLNQEITRDMILKQWPEAQVHMNVLWKDGNYSRVAKYMLLNATQSKDARGKNSRGFRCSRSIVTPPTREESMKRELVADPDDLEPRTGYYIDRDSIRAYWHPITGNLCVEYIEISMEDNPRLTRYSRGRPARREKYYPEYWDEQIAMLEGEEWT